MHKLLIALGMALSMAAVWAFMSGFTTIAVGLAGLAFVLAIIA
jgi:hypothetical protein